MMARPTSTCTPDGCTYTTVVGLIPGIDVSIDGEIWPGSPYDKHIDECPANGWASTKAHEAAESGDPS